MEIPTILGLDATDPADLITLLGLAPESVSGGRTLYRLSIVREAASRLRTLPLPKALWGVHELPSPAVA